MGLFRDIYLDYRRYRCTGSRSWGSVFTMQGFWATCLYRVSRQVHLRLRGRFLRPFGKAFCACTLKISEILTGISLPAACEIGEGLYIGHFGPIVVNSAARLGRNCNLSQCVTIGVGGRGAKRGVPKIGDRVYIGVNAILFGPITIGDDAAIGAGAVVTKSVPPRGVVVGNPAKVISYEGSGELVAFDGRADERAAQVQVDVCGDPAISQG